MKRTAIIFFFWYFLVISIGGVNRHEVVGPFQTQAGCEQYRLWAAAHDTFYGERYSGCWEAK